MWYYISMDKQKGKLFLISTPIGNLQDISLRAIETLYKVDILLCEDTRVTGKLLQRYREMSKARFRFAKKTILKDNEQISKSKIPTSPADRQITSNPKLVSYHDHNEERLNPQVISWLNEGKSIGLVADAGTPLISDPGYKLVRECLNQNIKVESIPGPSAVTAALTLSGFPPDKFLFIGYLPRKSGQRQKLFSNLAIQQFSHLTVIAFESPYRLVSSLNDLRDALGEIEVCICRELTKLYEEVKKGKVSEVIEYFENKKVKGEIVMLFEIEKEKGAVMKA